MSVDFQLFLVGLQTALDEGYGSPCLMRYQPGVSAMLTAYWQAWLEALCLSGHFLGNWGQCVRQPGEATQFVFGA